MKQRGFTIVELLVVIVVIGILAAITIVAYNGIQNRARDTDRMSDINAIRKALEVYKSFNGEYPEENATTWEYSYTDPQNFLSALKPYLGKTPVDPVNSTSRYYYYYLYDAGYAGGGNGIVCPAARGKFYVLGVLGLEASNGASISPGWRCEDPNTAINPSNGGWNTGLTRAAWGSFTN